MQIILVQAEIEKAIRNYVNSKVKIQEGQDIRIDLSASRGPEGFRANIDIVDEDAAPAPAPTPAPAPKATSSKAAAPAATTEASDDQAAVKAAKAAAEAKSKADKEATDQAAEAGTEASAEGNAAGEDPNPPFEVDPPAAAPEQPPVRKPLFGKSTAALNA